MDLTAVIGGFQNSVRVLEPPLIQNLFGSGCQNIQQCGQIGNVYGSVSVNIQAVLSASRNIRIVCQIVQQCGQIGNAHNAVAVQIIGGLGNSFGLCAAATGTGI